VVIKFYIAEIERGAQNEAHRILKGRGVYFTDSHEWVSVESGVGTVGITQEAKKEFSDVVYLELPKVGQKIQAGERVVVLESTKAAVDIYSPVSGEVVAINEIVQAEPQLLSQDAAHSNGWLFKVLLSDLRELDSLMNRKDYEKRITFSI
jgi:glycine cleavage system H protein